MKKVANTTKNTRAILMRWYYGDIEKVEKFQRRLSRKLGREITRSDTVRMLVNWGFERAEQLGIGEVKRDYEEG